MSEPSTPLGSLTLRLAESNSASWWLVAVPDGQQSDVAAALRDELAALGVAARCLPDDADAEAAVVTLVCVASASAGQFAASLDGLRSRARGEGTIVLLVAESEIGTFLQQAPHVASFIGGKIFATSVPRDEAPREYVERRLASLRASYGMSDDEAREALAKGERADGAWFDFHIALRPYEGDVAEHRGSLELLGYGYELRFPRGSFDCDVRWLRFDLNYPGHDNEARAVRAHSHPGDEDLQAPSPVLQPEEALELMLCDLLELPPKRRSTGRGS